MIGHDCPDALPVKFEPNFSDEDIQQYVEDREIISGPRRSVHLWEFLLELLMDEAQSPVIQWTDEVNGEFKLKSSEDVARKWGQRKHKEGMNYDKLSRALRYYYSKNIIKKVSGRRFVYKFVPSPEMHAAVNAIKAHMLRTGQKVIPTGPFPHLQTQDKTSLMSSTNNAKPYGFFPNSRNSISPRLAAPKYSLSTCHSPVRCRSPHRHEAERYGSPQRHDSDSYRAPRRHDDDRYRAPHRHEGEMYGEDRKLFRPHPYGFEYMSKMNLYNDEERILHPGRAANFRTRHHSERQLRQSEREMDLYRMTSPTDYPEHKTCHISYAEDKKIRELYSHSHSSSFGVHYTDRDDVMLRRKEEIAKHNEKYECDNSKNGFIDLSATRHHKLPLPHVVRQEFDRHTRNHQNASPKSHRVQDIIDYPTRHHHERHYSSSIYETQKRELKMEPYCYMYRRYAPMVDAATQTSGEHKERDASSEFDTRPLETEDAFVGDELKVERSPSATSSSPLNIKDRMSEGSPDVFSSAEMNSPISTPNSLIHHPLTPVMTPIPQQVLTSTQCKCGCMDKVDYPIASSVAHSNSSVHVTSVANDTVVVFPKEVY